MLLLSFKIPPWLGYKYDKIKYHGLNIKYVCQYLIEFKRETFIPSPPCEKCNSPGTTMMWEGWAMWRGPGGWATTWRETTDRGDLLRVKRHSWKWNLQYQPPNQCHLKPRWNLLKSLTNKTVRMVTISHQVLEWFSGSHTEPKQSVIASWNDLWYHHRSKNDVTWSFFRQKEEMNKGPSSRLRPQRHSSLILRQKVCTARKGLPDFFLTHPPRNH